jgi:hypothetical protein
MATRLAQLKAPVCRGLIADEAKAMCHQPAAAVFHSRASVHRKPDVPLTGDCKRRRQWSGGGRWRDVLFPEITDLFAVPRLTRRRPAIICQCGGGSTCERADVQGSAGWREQHPVAPCRCRLPLAVNQSVKVKQ